VEHITPRSRNGSDEQSNLAWSCMGCNDRKYTAVDAIDLITGVLAKLFNPRQNRWADHFIWTADFTQIVGHTAIGRATVAKLKLNRPELVKLRQILHAAGEPIPD
jgi:5-methylcytosine-specific restriction endonuclease McrA